MVYLQIGQLLYHIMEIFTHENCMKNFPIQSLFDIFEKIKVILVSV